MLNQHTMTCKLFLQLTTSKYYAKNELILNVSTTSITLQVAQSYNKNCNFDVTVSLLVCLCVSNVTVCAFMNSLWAEQHWWGIVIPWTGKEKQERHISHVQILCSHQFCIPHTYHWAIRNKRLVSTSWKCCICFFSLVFSCLFLSIIPALQCLYPRYEHPLPALQCLYPRYERPLPALQCLYPQYERSWERVFTLLP